MCRFYSSSQLPLGPFHLSVALNITKEYNLARHLFLLTTNRAFKMTHALALQTLCWLCGRNVKKYRVSHSCREYMGPLQEAFGIDVAEDDDEVHPKCFCNCCYAALQRKIKAAKESRVMLTSLNPVEWGTHTDENWDVQKVWGCNEGWEA